MIKLFPITITLWLLRNFGLAADSPAECYAVLKYRRNNHFNGGMTLTPKTNMAEGCTLGANEVVFHTIGASPHLATHSATPTEHRD
jgi:hypothetical protein